MRVVLFCLLSCSTAWAAASELKEYSLGWVHPQVVPVEAAFLRMDVPAAVNCLKIQSSDCEFVRNDFAKGAKSDPNLYFASRPERVELTTKPDVVHVKFPIRLDQSPPGLAVLTYERTEQGLKRSAAALAE